MALQEVKVVALQLAANLLLLLATEAARLRRRKRQRLWRLLVEPGAEAGLLESHFGRGLRPLFELFRAHGQERLWHLRIGQPAIENRRENSPRLLGRRVDDSHQIAVLVSGLLRRVAIALREEHAG